jgi:hypothetical protein
VRGLRQSGGAQGAAAATQRHPAAGQRTRADPSRRHRGRQLRVAARRGWPPRTRARPFSRTIRVVPRVQRRVPSGVAQAAEVELVQHAIPVEVPAVGGRGGRGGAASGGPRGGRRTSPVCMAQAVWAARRRGRRRGRRARCARAGPGGALTCTGNRSQRRRSPLRRGRGGGACPSASPHAHCAAARAAQALTRPVLRVRCRRQQRDGTQRPRHGDGG